MAKRKRHTAAQIIRKLEDADRRLTAGQSIAQVCQALEVSEATYHRWRNQYGGMKAEEAKRLKELELESTRLKKMVAELMLDKAMLKELAEENFCARHDVARLSGIWKINLMYRNAARVR